MGWKGVFSMEIFFFFFVLPYSALLLMDIFLHFSVFSLTSSGSWSLCWVINEFSQTFQPIYAYCLWISSLILDLVELIRCTGRNNPFSKSTITKLQCYHAYYGYIFGFKCIMGEPEIIKAGKELDCIQTQY